MRDLLRRIALRLISAGVSWVGFSLVDQSEYRKAQDEIRKLDRYVRSISERRRRTTWSRRRILQRLGRISEGVRFTPEGDGGIRVEMVDFSIHPGTCFNCNFLEY